ncbi:sprT-like domain-containing protein Spartan [Drosophila guanche]|uniref:Protein with SprT-like domain at the N terminus n=1 Tax=Drosophila guanche TaxID=7266 RepID=A0A3B0JQV2_DROGU|nr:sprT-like domain-containing protein Spartan [Drosophila guanche]SPP77860.1 blast:SprT-like domain-containing protein Spartan [Drosophila guanche]
MSEDSDFLFAQRLSRRLNGEEAVEKQSQPQSKKTADEEADYLFALRLQEEEQKERPDEPTDLDDSLQFVYPTKQANALAKSSPLHSTTRSDSMGKDYLNQTSNLVHAEWEVVDPTPNIFSMFVRFNEKFFQNRLGSVVLEWSKRMFSCAGICYLRSNRYTKEITIRLSEPLLKLRPRKDLVETLLHEMIHAYCYMLNIREGNGGHGPNFKRIMNTINQVAGTNISVYHNFHDEVARYKTHVWRCTGICQNRPPFHGYVRRTANRAPGPNDQWWEKHTRDCSGTFQKVSEPEKRKPQQKAKAEKPVAKATVKKDTSGSGDIRNFIGNPPAKKQATVSSIASGFLDNLVSGVPPTSYPGQSNNPFAMPKSKIRSISDLNQSADEQENTGARVKENFLGGQGYTLTSSKGATAAAGAGSAHDADFVRNIRQKRFGNVPAAAKEEPKQSTRKRSHSPDEDSPMIAWESYDDDVMVAQNMTPTVFLLSSDEECDGDRDSVQPKSDYGNVTSGQELTRKIKQEVMFDESKDFDDDDIVMIDDEYDDEQQEDVDSSLIAATELADQSVIDDLFGTDTLLAEFQLQNDVVATGSRTENNLNNDIVTCPICFNSIKRSQLSNHFEGCFITNKVEPPSFKPKSKSRPSAAPTATITSGNSRATRNRSSSKQVLRDAGYTEAEIAPLNLSSEEEPTPRQLRQRSLFKKTISCPKCGRELLGHQLDAHRSLCGGKL